jgi:large subunit ribosomal protein L15
LLKYNAEVNLTDLDRLGLSDVDLLVLKQSGLVSEIARVVKVIKTGVLTRSVTLRGVGVTAGAKQAIEALGGSVS